jgi:hypothetical protein
LSAKKEGDLVCDSTPACGSKVRPYGPDFYPPG